LTITKEQVVAAVDNYVTVRGNIGFFAEQEVS
jgi:hypothetical protein